MDHLDNLKSLIPDELKNEYMEWVKDSGYDESYCNRWDSKSRALEEQFLEEREHSHSNN